MAGIVLLVTIARMPSLAIHTGEARRYGTSFDVYFLAVGGKMPF
jgi:hypothetical protein